MMTTYVFREFVRLQAERKKVQAIKELLAVYDAVNANDLVNEFQTQSINTCKVSAMGFKTTYRFFINIAREKIRENRVIFPKGRYLRNLSEGMKEMLTSEFTKLYESMQSKPESLMVTMYFLEVGDSEIFEECEDFHKALRAKGYNKAAEYLVSNYLQDLSLEELISLLR